MDAGNKMFQDIEKRAAELKRELPGHYEFLKMQFEKADIEAKDREAILA